jgi:non-ribosomal peptide synthetase component F
VPSALGPWAERTPEAAALRRGDRVTSYRELARATSEVRRRVVRSGPPDDAPIAVAGEAREETVAEILGVLAAERAILLDTGERRVEVRRSDLAGALSWAEAALGIGPGDRVALALPLVYHLSILDLVGALGAGATLVLPPAGPLDARDAVGWLAGEGVSVLHLLPGMGHAWAARAGDRRLPALRRVWFSGEPLPDAVVLRWREVAPGAELWNVYDSALAPFAPAYGRVGRPARSGIHPFGAGAIEVLGPGGEPCPPETIGDLHVVHPRLGRVATGERARRWPDGRVEPMVEGDEEVGELEAALAGLSGVEGAAVVRALEGGGAALTAFVAGRVDRAAWRDALRELMREDAEPMPIITLDALPFLPDGRVDRARLRGAGPWRARPGVT